jgi:outer membrane murein-binding lipoprotein Lpp
MSEVDDLKDILLRNGFVPCDVPACNCGSWHPRYGATALIREIATALEDGGISTNGITIPAAVNSLIAKNAELEQRVKDARRKALEEAARAAEGIEQTRYWVRGSLYDTLRRETAAAIRTLIDKEPTC